MLHELLVIVALVTANGVLAGAEIAVVALRSSRARDLSEKDTPATRALVRLRGDPERFLATVQVGITVIGASAAAYGGGSFAVHLAPTLERVPAIGEHAEAVAFGIVVALVSFLSVVIGELVPKSLALRYAERYALLIARPVLLLSMLARPVVWLLTASSNLLLRAFGDRTTFLEARLSPDELQQAMEEAAKAGSMHPEASEIASRAIDFGDLTVAQVMVPRPNVVALPRRAPPGELKRILLARGRARMPVYDRSLDDVVGYVTLQSLLSVLLERGELALDPVLRAAHFVSESMRAVDLLTEMREHRSELSIAVDEQGNLAGIVTIEDLLEELVGEYPGAHDNAPARILLEADGAALVLGDVPIRDLNRELELAFPESPDFSTIAGLCLAIAGCIPERGDVLHADDGTTVEIVDASARHVKRVRIRRVTPRTDEGEVG